MVLEADNGAGALGLAKRHHEEIDAVVTDIVMPIMDDLELGKRLEHVRPQARTIHMSGYNDHAELLHDFARSPVPFLGSRFRSKNGCRHSAR